jgi:tight adherence protein C
MIETITVLLVFASVVLVFYGIRTKPVDAVEARLRAVQEGRRFRDPTLAQPFIRRAALPMMGGLARFVIRVMPPGWLQATEHKLAQSGGSITMAGFILIWVSIAAFFTVFSWILAVSFGFGIIGRLFVLAGGVALGLFLPQIWLSARVSDRYYKTRKSLPDALDLMTTSVEAGLSLDAALVRVAEFQRAPFQDELQTALQDMTLGKSRREALDELAKRLSVPEVVTFIQTVNQAEVTGAPIARVLRVQAEQVRVARRQAAEAQAQRAPLLMLIPLVLFIFPSLFVVLLAPAALTIIDLLTNSSVFNQ